MDATLELHELRADLKAAMNKLDALIERSTKPVPSDAKYVQGLARTKAIEWVLKYADGKALRPVEIWFALQSLGRDDAKSDVQVTTYSLWERNRIGRAGRGEYHAL